MEVMSHLHLVETMLNGRDVGELTAPTSLQGAVSHSSPVTVLTGIDAGELIAAVEVHTR